MIVCGCLAAEEATGQRTDLTIEEVPLRVARETVSYDPLLRKSIRESADPQGFLALSDHREMWIAEAGQPLAPLGARMSLPEGFDWYGSLCAAGDRVVASVGSYPEEQRRREMESPKAAFRAGPTPVGILIVSLREAKLVKDFRVDSVHPRVQLPDGERLPAQIRPWIQSCHWDGAGLIVGAYGVLARLDVQNESAWLLELDAELAFNRKAIFPDEKDLWVSMDEGGLSGGCVEKLSADASTRYCLLGYNNSEIDPDAILKHRGRLLTSSLAGIVEIDEARHTYVHYQLNTDRREMRVFELAVIRDQLWAIREDGFVKFDLPAGAATHFRLTGESISNDIHELAYFDGTWYVATDDVLVTVKPSSLE